MLLDSDAVLRALVTPDVVDACSIALLSNNQTIARLGSPIDSSYRTVESQSSRLDGISVRVDIPLSLIFRQLQPLLMIFAVSILFYLLTGVGLTLWFSHRNSLPIRSLTESLCTLYGGEVQKNEYAFLAGEIDRMDGDLKRTQQELIIRENAMRAVAVERLMCGAAYAEHEVDIASVLFQKFPPQYCLCLLRVQSECGDQATADAFLRKSFAPILMRLRNSFGASIEAHCAGGGILLFALPVQTGAHIKDSVAALNGLCERIYADCALRAVIAISDTFSGAGSLSQACNQARQILRVLPPSASRSVLRADLPEVSALVPIEYTDSQRFYETLLFGDEFGAIHMIQDAFSVVRGAVDGEVIAQVFYAFQRVFNRISFELRGSGTEHIAKLEYSDTASVDELISVLSEYVREISVSINERRERRARRFEQAILTYIDQHICESDLCARAVAEHFSIPERDLQSITRRAENASFFEYVENRRMHRARDMIVSTSLPISDISTSCGFALPNSFYKAFKRRFGMSPSALRESRIKNNSQPSET